MFKRNFFLASDLHVPKQVIDKFSEVSISSLMENGWFQFVDALERFCYQIFGSVKLIQERHEFDFEPISLYEFYYPLFIYSCHLARISLVFVLEVIWFRVQGRCRRLYSRCKRQCSHVYYKCKGGDGSIFMINASKPFKFRNTEILSASKMLTLSLNFL